MLVLRRRQGESIQVNCTEVTILEIEGTVVKLGFRGEDSVTRSELLDLAPPLPMPLDADLDLDLDQVGV